MVGVMLVIGALPANAQEPTPPPPIVGRVRAPTGRPLAGVEVVVNRHRVRTVTDSAGLFLFDAAANDTTVGFRRIGYAPAVFTMSPRPKASDTVVVELRPSPVELPDLVVSAPAIKPLRYAGTSKYDEVFRRMRLGVGSYVSRDDVDRRAAMSTVELLQGVPGVRIAVGAPGARDQTRIRFVRCDRSRAVAVFLDGARLMPPSPNALLSEDPVVEMLDRINPAEVEMLEVYRGASQIPGVYHWDGCAVIAIWTRWNR